jgi:hypothetical protein
MFESDSIALNFGFVWAKYRNNEAPPRKGSKYLFMESGKNLVRKCAILLLPPAHFSMGSNLQSSNGLNIMR